MSVLAAIVAAAEAGSDKTAFYVLGGLLAAWAVGVSAVGITQPDFPGDQGRTRLVYGVSVVLVVAALAAAVLTS